MTFPRRFDWLPVLGVPVVVALVLGWLLLGFAGDRRGQVPLTGPGKKEVVYFIDAGGKLTAEEMGRLPEEQWRAYPETDHLMGPRGGVLWLRVVLRNGSPTPQAGVLENVDFFPDRVELWMEDDGGGRIHQVSGEGVAAREKVLPGREVAFPLAVAAGTERTLLLRFQDSIQAYTRLEWWPDGAVFHGQRARGLLAEGVYFGAMLALLGYNTVLWWRLRRREMGWYVLYLTAGAGFLFLARAQLQALGGAMGSPWLETLLTVAMALSGPFLIQFARAFLELRTHFPLADRWVARWSHVVVALAVMAVLVPGRQSADWMRYAVMATVVTHVGLLVVTLWAWRAGVWQARFFALSFGCLFAGSLPVLGMWLVGTTHLDGAMRGLMIGSAMEMLLLSLALAERFSRMQRMLVEETEQRRMMEEAYSDELEEEVRERTRELRLANADKDRMLTVIGHDLRGPLTGLMRSSDEAGGEFAGTVARTGRTLLLMIDDLVLWARLRAGTGSTGTHRMRALILPAVALHHALAEYEGVALEVEVPEELRVETDLVLAQTLVRNLLANALKFARTRVSIHAEPVDGGVRLVVGNDGPALTAEVAARLAAGEDGPVTATGGMGLRLCREICQALGTRLETATPAAGGTEFSFTLKRKMAEEHER